MPGSASRSPPRRSPARSSTADGVVLDPATVLPAGASVFLYRDLPDEVPVPFDIPVLYQTTTSWWSTNRISWPRCRGGATSRRPRWCGCAASWTCRAQPGPSAGPVDGRGAAVHHAARGSGRVPDDVRPRRGPQDVFGQGGGQPGHRVAARGASRSSSGAAIYKQLRCRRAQRRDADRARRPDGLYRLTPRTGRTHQLRVHMARLGLPIYGDPLYPTVIDVAADDFCTPLQLLAQRIEFDDPLSGTPASSSAVGSCRRRVRSTALDARTHPHGGLGSHRCSCRTHRVYHLTCPDVETAKGTQVGQARSLTKSCSVSTVSVLL